MTETRIQNVNEAVSQKERFTPEQFKCLSQITC